MHEPGDDWWTLTGVAADERMTLDFNAVPEPRTRPNRVHWDVVGRSTTCWRAARPASGSSRRGPSLADPEGNEFCVFPPG